MTNSSSVIKFFNAGFLSLQIVLHKFGFVHSTMFFFFSSYAVQTSNIIVVYKVWKTYTEVKEHLESCGNQDQRWGRLLIKNVHVPISVHEYQGSDNEKP